MPYSSSQWMAMREADMFDNGAILRGDNGVSEAVEVACPGLLPL